MGRLNNKVAIVTGGARGIGEATVRRFAAEGATVFIADINLEAASNLAGELGPRVTAGVLDVTRSDDWASCVQQIVDQHHRIDILVNNAGVGYAGPVLGETEQMHRHMLDVNLTGVWLGMRAVLPNMIEQGGGSIVNISSIDGVVGVSEMTSYAATKFAVTGMTKSTALEVGKHGVRVNAVHPGFIATPLLNLDQIPADKRVRIDDALARQPMPRPGKPEEIASAVLFFASDDSSFCTGSSLVVDGGHTAGPYRVPME